MQKVNRSLSTTRRHVKDYQHMLCRANLLLVRQQQSNIHIISKRDALLAMKHKPTGRLHHL